MGEDMGYDQDNVVSPGLAQKAGRPDANKGNGGDYAKDYLLQIPSISLPKGGGALRSIDEKFQANPGNGTAALTIPLPVSTSRTAFGTRLNLQFNSGSGNSEFGLGWSIDLPSIHRRTEKFLPRYFDAEESDVFQFTGVEDMVPDIAGPTPVGGNMIQRYWPRIEGGFTLIEKVTTPTGNVFWKTTTRDNIVAFFGLTAQAQVADPAVASGRIFKWLPELSYDDKGNCVQYTYAAENLQNVPDVLHERNRLLSPQPLANTYLKQIQYGNTAPYYNTNVYDPAMPSNPGYLFTLVLDYGDIDPVTPTPSSVKDWDCRFDPFSDYHAGFEIRTYRLCKRFLLFHYFAELGPGSGGPANACLVRSLDLTYQYYNNPSPSLPDPPYNSPAPAFIEADFVASATMVAYTGNATVGYTAKALPAMDFSYNPLAWDDTVQAIGAEALANAPSGLSNKYQFTDLWGEGIPGILTEEGEGWYYKSNLGNGNFTPAEKIAPKPSFTGLSAGTLQFQDLTADGRKFIVSTLPPFTGYFELTDEGHWLPYKPFDRYPRVDFRDANTKMIDLNGDGMPDLIVSEEQVFTWYPAAGVAGYDSPELAYKPFDEEKGAAIVFSDPVQCIFLADMSGDGLTDIVRIRNGEICYWPNKGFGVFGAKVNMTNAPLFDLQDTFNPAYLHLADVSGTGATDVLYLGQDRFRAWINLSGNAWSPAWEIDPFPDTATQNQLAVADLLGNGTACIIWSSPLPNNADTPMRYIDLMGGNKPYLLNGYNNNVGKQVDIEYKSSSFFYLADELAGTPWITKLPFPVQCLSRVAVTDEVSGASYSNVYTYHHGYYDHPEREFRGFGRVEQTDTDVFDSSMADPLDQAPVLTKTWFHTGAYFGWGHILDQFAQEYFKHPAFDEYQLPQPQLPVGLTDIEVREAFRACKGMVIRREVYALDGDALLSPYPYSAAEHSCLIRLLQPRDGNRYAVFLNTESEAITYQYERNPTDPRIAHTLNISIDQYGNIMQSASVVYPRQDTTPPPPVPGKQPVPAAVIAEQQKMHIVYAVNNFTNDVIGGGVYRLRQPSETIAYELTGATPAAACFLLAELGAAFSAAAYITYETIPNGTLQIRRLKHKRILYQSDDLSGPLSLGTMQSLGIVYQTYHLAFTQSIIDGAYAGKAGMSNFQDGKYISSTDPSIVLRNLFPVPARDPGEWWVPSGTIGYFAAAAASFYLPYQYTDAFDNTTALTYDPYHLLIAGILDPVGNTTTVLLFNYRTLTPQTVQDSNGNIAELSYDILGLVVGTALTGKNNGTEGDDLVGFKPDPAPAAIADFFTDPVTYGPGLLQNATTRFVYDYSTIPVRTGLIARENHLHYVADPRLNIVPGAMQYSFEYSDGLGRIVMRKLQTEPGLADHFQPDNTVILVDTTPNLRWIGKGRTILNNKGKPVKQYEPYFSDNPGFDDEPALVENGVSPLLYYDAPGRLIRTEFPDGTLSKTVFDAWVQISYDQNDLVLDPTCQWYLQRTGGGPLAGDPWQADAAAKTTVHNNTPSVTYLDTLGRAFFSVADNTYKDRISGLMTEVYYNTQTILDIEGNALAVIDPMGNTVMQHQYNMLNQWLHQTGMDAGERWMLNDCMGKAYCAWDINAGSDYSYLHQYDALHRPTSSAVNGKLYELRYYGDDPTVVPGGGQTDNLRGKTYLLYDGTGLVTYEQYDFKGNLVQSSRRFTTLYMPSAANPSLQPVLWTGTPATDNGFLQPVEYVELTQYDALNRPVLFIQPWQVAAPAGDIVPPYAGKTGTADCTVPGYNQSGRLSTVNVYLDGAAVARNMVSSITHNEKGQRVNIVYGNATATNYTYDPLTFRLIRIHTTSDGGTVSLQDLDYYFDPVGNITHVIDNAQQTVFFNNKMIDPSGDYTYDAIYRLITALGREHIVLNTPPDDNDSFRCGLPQPGDMSQMQNYTQYYTYDASGNMLQMGNTGSWSRICTYATGAPAPSNRLLTSTPGDDNGATFNYTYDTHGNMLAMAHLTQMDWDFKDQLLHLNLSGGGNVYYQYEATGQRARKVWVKNANLICERLYLGNFELYTETDSTGTINLQRETLHLMDDRQRIAMVETKTVDTAGSDPATLDTPYTRYQYGNHLGTACLELDDEAQIISYEEYYPFGSTSYQAVNAAINATAKRYRYTGKERDGESGLYYHGARYYAPWLCRWTAADPKSLIDGLNLYAYCRNAPLTLVDSTGTGSSGASEGSVLTGTIDPTLDKKGIGYNTETKLEITLADGTVVNRRFDRFYQDPEGNWVAIEAKGEKPEDLTPNELLADKKIQEQGASFRVLQSSGAPPPGHGVAREDIAFTKDFVGVLKPGHLLHVHGNVNHVATADMPQTITAGVFKEVMEQIYPDAPGHEGMVRKINPNRAPTWITVEQAAAEYRRNTGRDMSNPVERSMGYMAVTPKNHFLAPNRDPANMSHQIVGATIVAIPVILAPLWVPPAAEAAPTGVRVAQQANRVRVAVEKVVPQARVVDEYIEHEVEDFAVETGKKALRWITE